MIAALRRVYMYANSAGFDTCVRDDEAKSAGASEIVYVHHRRS